MSTHKMQLRKREPKGQSNSSQQQQPNEIENQAKNSATISPAQQQQQSSSSSQSNKRKWSLDCFKVGRLLGKGKFSDVYMAKDKDAKYIIALKVLKKEKISQLRNENQVRREIELQLNLKHPNILRLYTFFDDEARIYFVLEFASGGALSDALMAEPHNRFDERKSAKYIKSLVSALIYLDERNIIHRDIKPENLLIGKDGELKLADFGCSVHEANCQQTEVCGTLAYLSPEMVQKKPHSKTVDLWSTGVLSYELLCGSVPFHHENIDVTKKKIINVDYELPRFVSKTAADLIANLLVFDPNGRLPLKEIAIHPWLNSQN